jgi:hypothetical protein
VNGTKLVQDKGPEMWSSGKFHICVEFIERMGKFRLIREHIGRELDRFLTYACDT